MNWISPQNIAQQICPFTAILIPVYPSIALTQCAGLLTAWFGCWLYESENYNTHVWNILLSFSGLCELVICMWWLLSWVWCVLLFPDDKEKNKAEILLLSIAANIVSRHTSMVGVDNDRKEKVVGDMIQREVPLMTSRRLRKTSGRSRRCTAPATIMAVSIWWVILLEVC